MFRLTRKNRLLAEIAANDKRVERANNSITEFRRGTGIRDREFIEQQILKNQEIISECTANNEELHETVRQLDRGELDDDIQAELDQNREQVEQKRAIQEKREKMKAETDSKNEARASSFAKKQRDVDYQNRVTVFQMQKAYERFCEIEIPDYIKDNLRTMPNNKGYIWKGVRLYGRLPPENGPVVLFEKQREVMYIHEIYEREAKLFRKQGQAKRELVSTTPRRCIRKTSGISVIIK